MEESKAFDTKIPQWKRDLILRRRAVGRVLPTGSGSVQLTCPSVVAAVRLAEYSVNSSCLRNCESEREQTGVRENMRFVEQVNSSNEFVNPCVLLNIKGIITKIESGSIKDIKMGEEKTNNKPYNSSLIYDKKVNDFISTNDDGNYSDSSEEFKYGPGIVSKLKSKYLSLTLRESQGKVRPSLDILRKASSLENILNVSVPEKVNNQKVNYSKNNSQSINGSSLMRHRNLNRNHGDSIKRARSVEVLNRCEKGSIIKGNKSIDMHSKTDENNIDEKNSFRSSLGVSEKELPPPDLVKHTLKIFEKSDSAKHSSIVKKKNQINSLDAMSAAKVTIFSKPILSNNNGVQKTDTIRTEKFKNIPESVKYCRKDLYKRKKFNDYSSTKVIDSSSESLSKSNFSAEKTTALENKSFKAIASEPVIKNIVLKESSVQSLPQEENSLQKNILAHIEQNISLDLADSAMVQMPKASLTNSTSLKPLCNRDNPESAESISCVSPVLVRAPPSIVNGELHLNNSPMQHMKKVGVIRPIITNKPNQSNLANLPLQKLKLTEKEIEKNLINKVKSTEEEYGMIIESSNESVDDSFMNEGTKSKQQNEILKKRGQFWDKKPNTMVFNFSNRKTIPDYIENDGLIFTTKKDKPKLGESDMVRISGGTEDSSTDFDLEEITWGPPSPCGIVFEGDNILINGKSNIQSKPKSQKMKIQFNDETTTVFEYPSEASLLDDRENMKSELDSCSTNGVPSGLPISFRSNNLANYTPSKVILATDFQLGVTPTPLFNTQKAMKPIGEQEENTKEENESQEEKEGQSCLRPADEDTIVSWSSETATDLLF